MTYVAQNLEDKWISDNWDKLNLPEQGFFVELGAGDGVTLSNTYWLEVTKGWYGLLIEPDPRHKIVDRSRSIKDFSFIGPAGEVKLGWSESPFLSGQLRASPIRIPMQAIPLSDILCKHRIEKVDLISIDTEGTEMDVWKTLDLNRWRPQIAIIELVTEELPDHSEDIIAAMKDDNYSLVHRTTHNGIFRCGEN